MLIMQGVRIPCFRCKEPIWLADASQAEREHVTPLALGGEDTPENCRFSHKECHNFQTNGSRATSYGSDKHAIAKVRRLSGANKPKRKHNWPKGRKIPSRKFAGTVTRNG